MARHSGGLSRGDCKAGWNYSPLNQINLDNVKDLTVAWTLPLGILDSYEGSPLVIGSTMYIVTPKPNYVYAIDLTRDGVIKWEFRPGGAEPGARHQARLLRRADARLAYALARGLLAAGRRLGLGGGSPTIPTSTSSTTAPATAPPEPRLPA